MKLPNFRRIFRTDYEVEFQALVEKLSVTINQGLEVLYDLSNRKISLRDNILCSVKDVTVTMGASGVPKTTTGFQVDIPGRIIGIQVLYVLNNTDGAYPTTSPFITFTQDNFIIFINHITGLEEGKNYTLRLVAYGE